MKNIETKEMMKNKLSLLKDERGVTAVEYAIVAVVISGVVIAAYNTALGDAISAAITQVVADITTASSR
ncbi:Flp family type IVb pilin [Vibrio jasicida]|uniref:Flp family type IVb pilin n=1 Tax=Vibrio jasicida TaxID=766224 RepID=UPI00164069A8|nr:Flp family type IVb pilin [Vibrio jasicida]